MICRVVASSWEVASEKAVCRSEEIWKPVDGIAGFRAGMCRTRTQRQTSRVAKTTDLPGTILPLSPPSPIFFDMLTWPVDISLPSAGTGLSSFSRNVISFYYLRTYHHTTMTGHFGFSSVSRYYIYYSVV